ncbi:anti-sigma factor [Roseivirga sp. E12]|uniref:anti-sigma factor family protein n=1 Tax=Roseivirga sp. E12 TaxID=2819237 RepID=UPI001ABC3FC0|nr:hypothetical protein [Roseivirga sp. E12]MBO3700636.1 hypothetical protein [Roseivirga sp. E12]
MKYKPTEETLVAYLYGELDSEQAELVEVYLEANPEEKQKLKALSDTRMIFNELEDEELPGQLAFIEPAKNEEWLYWRKYVAIAATLLLLLTFGWLTGFKVNYDAEGLYLGYGEIERGLSEEEISDMIFENNASMAAYLQDNMKLGQDSLNLKINALQANNANEEIINQIFEREKDALINQMVGLNDKLSGDYRDILRQIVVNFSNNIESQRIEDLRGIQAAFTELEDATINKQFQFENALVDLEEKVNTVIANNSNNK